MGVPEAGGPRRFNVDAFNAFNIQGLVNPNPTDGTQAITTSSWTPRQIRSSVVGLIVSIGADES